MRRTLVSFLAIVTVLTTARAEEVATLTVIALPEMPLGEVAYPGGQTLKLNVGIGSAAFRDPKDPAGIIHVMTDRGPNLDCAGIDKLAGLGIDRLCANDEKAKNFPLPQFTPAIYRLELVADKASLAATIPLKGQSGAPITGLPNPLTATDTEAGYDTAGKLLESDPSGLDTEAFVKLPDGSFWIGEEYASSILEVAADGTIRRRIVPAGIGKDLGAANYAIEEGLPAIVAKRALNRGIENIAMSGDGATLYVLMQSPLANPDAGAYKKSRNVRLWKLDRATGKVLGQYVYVLDEAASFRSDNEKEPKKQNDVRLSEMVWLAGDRLLVVERISKTTKFYVIDLTAATSVPEQFDDLAAAPSLEQLAPADLPVTPVAKTLLLDSDEVEGMPAKIEAVAVMSEREMIVLNDSDFGIEGATTEMLRVTFKEPLLR